MGGGAWACFGRPRKRKPTAEVGRNLSYHPVASFCWTGRARSHIGGGSSGLISGLLIRRGRSYSLVGDHLSLFRRLVGDKLSKPSHHVLAFEGPRHRKTLKLFDQQPWRTGARRWCGPVGDEGGAFRAGRRESDGFSRGRLRGCVSSPLALLQKVQHWKDRSE
jgi:hypothetical protein